MRLYLAPESSLELIRYLRSVGGADGIEGTPMRKRVLLDAINTVHDIDELDVTAQIWLKHAGSPIHAYVCDHAKGTKTKQLVTHVLSHIAPNGAFIDLGHGVCICSPQFTFMQMAAQVDLLEAVLIGMELCGTYSLWNLEPLTHESPSSWERPRARACAYNVPPAMQLVRTEAFVERLSGLRGAVGARAALRYVLNGAASPMETATYLLLCLPKRLGGYGLPKPLLNPKIVISNPDGSKERYPDLFWMGANIDVEYNSVEAHGGEWSRYRDSKREVELAVANIKVLPLTRRQLTNASEFDEFAQGLRRMLGIRARGKDLGWQYRHDELRNKLLSEWS